MTNTVRGSCHHDCPDTCVWDVTVEDGRAVQLRGNADHPTTRGQLCPKVNRFLDRVYHPDRLLTPLRRSGPKGSGQFEPISWTEAIDLIARRLQDTLERRGGESVLQFSFDGTQGVVQKGVLADRFCDAIGASDIRRHLCGVTSWLGAADVSGVPYSIDPEDLRHSRLIILWGTNTLITNRHLWATIEEARSQGAVVVVIDPVRTVTAERADRHLAIRPGGDIALVGAMLHVLERDSLLDEDWLRDHTSGYDELRSSVAALDPIAAEPLTGLAAAEIEWLAHEYASRRPAAIRSLVGPEHRSNGRETMRAIATLPAVTGSWRDVGGGLARSTQAYFETALAYPDQRPTRRLFNMAQLGEVLDPTHELDPPIEALLVHNSNPAVILPDQERVVAGLRREDLFTVVIEQFLTDTAAHADVILPATTQLEHLDLGIAWGHLYVSLNRPAIEPVGDSLPNTEIFRRLAAAMGLDDPSLYDSDEDLVRQLLDSDHPWAAGISFEQLQADGWARLNVAPGTRPNVDFAPNTPDERLQLHALTDIEPVRGTREHPLILMSPKQHAKFLNANYAAFEKHHPAAGAPTVTLHPSDARSRSIDRGDWCIVVNERGALTLQAEVDESIPEGAVSVPFGWWHRSTPEQRSVNVLTNPSTPANGEGSAAFLDTFVEVRPAGPDSAGADEA